MEKFQDLKLILITLPIMNGLNDASGFSRKVPNSGREKMILIYGYHTNKFTLLRIDSCGLPAIPY